MSRSFAARPWPAWAISRARSRSSGQTSRRASSSRRSPPARTPSSVALGLSDGTVSVRALPRGAEMRTAPGTRCGGLRRRLRARRPQADRRRFERDRRDLGRRTRAITGVGPGRSRRIGRSPGLPRRPTGLGRGDPGRKDPGRLLGPDNVDLPLGPREREPRPDGSPCRVASSSPACAVSPDGKRLAAGYRGPDGHGALIWDLATRKVERTIAPELELVLGIAFSPGDAGSPAPARREWPCSMRASSSAGSSCGATSRPGSRSARTTRSWRSRPRSSGPCGSGTSPSTGRSPCWIARTPNGALTFSPDGRYLDRLEWDAVRLWTPWMTDEKLTLPGHLGGIPGIAVNREGTLLASAGKDRTVRIWDAASGRLLKTLSDFRGPVQAVAFGPDDARLVTAEFNGDLRIWDIATGTVRIPSRSGPGPTALVDRVHRRTAAILAQGIAPGRDLASPGQRRGSRRSEPHRRWNYPASSRISLAAASAPTGIGSLPRPRGGSKSSMSRKYGRSSPSLMLIRAVPAIWRSARMDIDW